MNNTYTLDLMWNIIKNLSEEEQKKWLKALQKELKFKEPLTYEEAEDEICFGIRDKEALRALIKVRPQDERPVLILEEVFGIVKGVPKNININELEEKLRLKIEQLFLRGADDDMRREYKRGEFERITIELEHLETYSVDEFGDIHHNGNALRKKDIYPTLKTLRQIKRPEFIQARYRTPLC